MRQIDVSTELFGLIRAARQDGEECEDDILKRILTGWRVEASESQQNLPGGRANSYSGRQGESKDSRSNGAQDPRRSLIRIKEFLRR